MTLRDNTERPETVSIGTNELISTNAEAIEPNLSKLLAGQWKKGKIPHLWEGKLLNELLNTYSNSNDIVMSLLRGYMFAI